MTPSSLAARYADRLGLESSEDGLRRRAHGTIDDIVDLIDELLTAYVRSIFEDLDVIAARAAGKSRGIPTDLDSLTAKLVATGRGGYCHEHATLIRAVLRELGLSAHPLLARVHLGRREIRARTADPPGDDRRDQGSAFPRRPGVRRWDAAGCTRARGRVETADDRARRAQDRPGRHRAGTGDASGSRLGGAVADQC